MWITAAEKNISKILLVTLKILKKKKYLNSQKIEIFKNIMYSKLPGKKYENETKM
jgi:hypothetical protein